MFNLTLRNTLTRLLLLIGFIATFGCAPNRPPAPAAEAVNLQTIIGKASESNGRTVAAVGYATEAVDRATTNPSELDGAKEALVTAGDSAKETGSHLKDASGSAKKVVTETKKLDKYVSRVEIRNRKLEDAWLSPKMKWTVGITTLVSILFGGLWAYFRYFTAAGIGSRLLSKFNRSKLINLENEDDAPNRSH